MKQRICLALCVLLMAATGANAREWTLRQCIDYARANNIQVQNAQLKRASAEESLLQAQASRYPTLNASTGQNVNFSMDNNPSYTGNYSLQSGVVLFNGGRISNSIKKAEINAEAGEYDIAAAQNDIEVAVTQAYLNVLYAKENVTTARNNVESSEAQWKRAREMYDEGSISLSEYAQMESQHSSDLYQLAVSESSLAQYTLNLKQLLELGINEDFAVFYPEISDENVIMAVPAVSEVYEIAEENQPQMKSSRLGIESAKVNEEIVAASGIPSVSASAVASTLGSSNIGIGIGDSGNQKSFPPV